MRPALRFNVVQAAIPVGFFAICLVGMAFNSMLIAFTAMAYVALCVAYQRTLKCMTCGRRLYRPLGEPWVYSSYVAPKLCPKCGEPLR
jgi:hypothetical protein